MMDNKSEVSENCLGCIFHYHTRFSSFASAPCLQISCSHANERPEILIFYPAIQICTSIALLMLFTYECLYNGYWSKKYFEDGRDALLVSTFFLNSLYYVRTALTMTLNLLRGKMLELTILELHALLSNFKILQNKTILSEETVNWLRVRNVRVNCFVLASTCLYALIILSAMSAEWTKARALATILVFYTDNITYAFFIFVTLLYKTVICDYQQVVINQLNGVLKGGFAKPSLVVRDNMVRRSSSSLETFLKTTVKYYVKLNLNYSLWNSFCNLTIMFLPLLSTLIIVVCVFTIYVCVKMQAFDDLNFEFLELQIRIYISIAILVYWIMVLGTLEEMRNDLLTYLFKFPVTKLESCESEQLEILITELRIESLVIRASDVFDIRREWLASMAGVVVTYSLVAMQFHTS